MLTRAIWVFLAATILVPAWASVERPRPSPGTVLELHENIEILEDSKRTFTLEEVSRAPLADNFRSEAGLLPDIGATHSGYWLRVWPKLPDDNNVWLLYVRQTELDRLCAYWPRLNAGYISHCTGLDARRAGEFDYHRDYILEVPTDVDPARPWYVYAHSDTWLALPLELLTRDLLLQLDHRYEYMWGLYYGAYFAVVIFALFTTFFLRDRLWLFFATHYGALGLAFLALQGRPMDFDFIGNIWWATHGGPFFISLFVAAGAMFYRRYLETALYLPRTDKALQIVMLAALLNAAVAALEPMWGFQILGIVGLSFVVLVIAAALVRARAGHRPAYYALSAMGLMLVIGGIKAVEVLGIELLPPEPSLNLFRFLTLAGALVLVLGLTDRILLLQRERDFAARENEHRRLELEQSNAELQRFTTIASHDLKQPLRGISGFSALLSRRYADKLDQRANEYLDFIIQGAKQADSMIGNLLELSQVRQKPIDCVALDSGDVVRRALAELEKQQPDISARCSIMEPMPRIVADADQMQKLFQHLLENAFRHGGATPDLKVIVRGESVTGGWQFSVTDNGPGIPENLHERVFEIFYRVDRESPLGTGRGLALCKRVVAQHGGRLWVESTVGEGSVFHCWLPHFTGK